MIVLMALGGLLVALGSVSFFLKALIRFHASKQDVMLNEVRELQRTNRAEIAARKDEVAAMLQLNREEIEVRKEEVAAILQMSGKIKQAD